MTGGWGAALKKVRHDLDLAGSPERCLWRSVVETQAGERLVLEEIAGDCLMRKREMAGVLAHLSGAGLGRIHPYRRSREGGFVHETAGRFWLARPYIEGGALKRPDYAFEAWRGVALAGFLKDFHTRGRSIPHSSQGAPFSIKDFIYSLMQRLADHRPDLQTRLHPVLCHLEEAFMAAHDLLPTVFCHGDYHPLNVIWSEKAIVSVIDWEFCGYKPELYDLALLIGCLGMEIPDALVGPLTLSLLAEFTPCCSEIGMRHLIGLVMAIRFAWLSEWLRAGDEEMVILECVYLELLLRERGALKEAWLGQ